MDDILILTDEATNFGFENESGMIIITNDVCWSNPGQKTIRAKRFYLNPINVFIRKLNKLYNR